VALSGVVINDAILIIDKINVNRRSGQTIRDAVIGAGVRRFRPILLTSLTTFFGLMPMILETSVQAQFLIPMAISLGFGILFSTLITLVLIPALYVVLEDFHALFAGKERKGLAEKTVRRRSGQYRLGSPDGCHPDPGLHGLGNLSFPAKTKASLPDSEAGKPGAHPGAVGNERIPQGFF